MLKPLCLIVSTLNPIVGITSTYFRRWSQFRIVVFPDASSPNMRMRTSLFLNHFLETFVKIAPIKMQLLLSVISLSNPAFKNTAIQFWEGDFLTKGHKGWGGSTVLWSWDRELEITSRTGKVLHWMSSFRVRWKGAQWGHRYWKERSFSEWHQIGCGTQFLPHSKELNSMWWQQGAKGAWRSMNWMCFWRRRERVRAIVISELQNQILTRTEWGAPNGSGSEECNQLWRIRGG